MSRRPEPISRELDQLADAFTLWRRTRVAATGATPARLRRRAVALTSVHRVATIARALGINPSAIERWSVDANAVCTSSAPAFVALPSSTDEEIMQGAAPLMPGASERPELVLRWPGGAELVARGEVPRATVAAILEAFAPTAAASTTGARR